MTISLEKPNHPADDREESGAAGTFPPDLTPLHVSGNNETILRDAPETYLEFMKALEIISDGISSPPFKLYYRRIKKRRPSMDRAPRAESENRLRSLSDAAFEGIAVSQNGRIVDSNATFVTLFGYDSLGEIIGKEPTAFAASQAKSLISQRHHEGSEEAYEAVCVRKDGSTFHAELRGRQILWCGAPARVTAVQDISARKAAEDALKQSQASLIEAQRVAKMGSWEYDVITEAVTWSEGMYRLMGIDSACAAPDYPHVLTLYHPDDSERLAYLVTRAIEYGEKFEIDLRRDPAAGEHAQWYHCVGIVTADAAGKCVQLTGTLTDITERVLSEERFRVLFEYSSDAHLLWDETGIIDCNDAGVAMFGCVSKTQLKSLHPAQLSPEFQPDGRRSAERRHEIDKIAWASKSYTFDWVHKKLTGEEFTAEVTLTPVTLRGRPTMISVWHDLTERKRAEQQIKDYAIILEYQKEQLEAANVALSLLATTDGLTGLKNHRAFQERLAQETDLAARHGQPLSVVLLDVDHFKQFNDAFGHPEGDEVLRQAARILLECGRESDMAARYGGEEFVLLLPQTDAEGAAAIAERIRQTFEETDWCRRPVTVSIGVAASGGDGRDGDLVFQADKALYRSKSAGRNRVTIFEK